MSDEPMAEEAWLEEAARYYREPPPRSPAAVDAVVARAMATRRRPRRWLTARLRTVWTWLRTPRLHLSPLGGAACAAAVAVAILLARGPHPEPVVEAGTVRHQFVLVAPGAQTVSLVGDFNGWDLTATPLRRRGTVWTIEMPLPPGRHVYSFVVDGAEWVPDATAPRAPDDEFGRASSVLLL